MKNEIIEIKNFILENAGQGNGSCTIGLDRFPKTVLNKAIKELLYENKITLKTGLSCVEFSTVPTLNVPCTYDGINGIWFVNHFKKVLSTMNYSIFVINKLNH